MDKIKKKKTLRKSFIYDVLCTFMMGALCASFEEMRQALYESNKQS